VLRQKCLRRCSRNELTTNCKGRVAQLVGGLVNRLTDHADHPLPIRLDGFGGCDVEDVNAEELQWADGDGEWVHCGWTRECYRGTIFNWVEKEIGSVNLLLGGGGKLD